MKEQKEKRHDYLKNDLGRHESQLPSQFQPTDQVGLQMLINMMEAARDGKVTKASFLIGGKVKYDIEIPVVDSDETVTGYFRIANVDSAFLIKPFDNDLHYNSKRDISSREDDVKKRAIVLSAPGAHPMTEVPRPDSTGETSIEVVVDLTGYRKLFSIGFYDFVNESWVIADASDIEFGEAKWMDILPFADRD